MNEHHVRESLMEKQFPDHISGFFSTLVYVNQVVLRNVYCVYAVLTVFVFSMH